MLEICVVTCVLGVMAGSTLFLGSLRIEQQRIEATQARLKLIEAALLNYAEVNGKLPCPANNTLPYGAVNHGEMANGNDCVGGSITADWVDGHVVGGGIPFAALGLPVEAALDAWDRRIVFAVDARMTREAALSRNPRNSSCGSITLEDESGKKIAQYAIFLLMSHGIDGHGAYSSTGNLLTTGITNASTVINAAPTRHFRSHGYVENPQDSFDRFDDILHYKTRQQFSLHSDTSGASFSVNNNQTPQGWVYIPATVLADGRRVPAFEVMRFEASNPYGNGIPVSAEGNIPWSGVTFTQARSACQKLGGDTETGSQGVGTLMEYDIISESQWLAIAKHTAKDSRNWVDGCEGDSGLIAGHRDSSPANALSGHANDALGYHGTLNDNAEASIYNRSQRRTLYLPSGAVIWDLAGNLPEWSYCDLAGHCLAYGQTDRSAYTQNTVAAIGNYDFTNLPSLAPPRGYDNAYHTGRLNIANGTTSNGLMRGGGHSSANSAGIFQVSVGQESTATAGFRCARHPEPEPFLPVNLMGLEIWYDASDIDGDGIEEGAGEGGVDAAAACAKTTTPMNDGCVRIWRNKALNGKYHARSKRLNGNPSGNENNVPTLNLAGVNGKPAVNFDAGAAQWFDTHHGIANAPSSDNGQGFDFAGRGEFSIFIVGRAQNWNAVVAGSDDVNVWWPHFVLFPLNINEHNGNSDYVFMLDNHMQGNDAGNTFCRADGVLLGALDLLCLRDPLFKVNYACAQMGGISSPGLNHNSPHIASGVFKKGQEAGLSAYVDGKATHMTDSSVHPQNDVIAGRQCLLGALLRFLKIKMSIGMMRGDQTVRTIGNISEIIVFSRALSATERFAIERYLADKYNIPTE